MRILRGQSNLEVSSKGFALFVVGLVLATFVGGAVRVALSSDQVHRRIITELRNRFPKHEFQIARTEVLLSRGFLPGLGLRVRSLSFKQEVCGKLSFVLTIPEAILPLNFWSLVRGNPRLNDVEIHGGELHLDYHDCPPKTASEASTAAPAKTSGEAPQKSIQAPRLNWASLAVFMDGIELKDFAVTYEKNPTWKLVFNSAYMSLGRELNARARVDVQKSLPFGALSHPVDFELTGEGQMLQWSFNSEFKEGNVKFTGSFDTASEAALAKVAIHQVPLKDIMNELFQMGVIEHDLKLKATWLSCNLKWEGHLKGYSDMPVNLRDCRIEGGYGRAELAQADLWLNGPENFKVPAHFVIHQMQMQPVVEAFNRSVLPAVFSRLGDWSGEFNFKAPNSWNLDGALENAEIVFANQSVHGKQLIDRVHTQLALSGGKIIGKVDELKLHDGEFAGSFHFNLVDDWRNGTFQVQVDKLLLSPAIQKLMLGGGMSALSGQGEGTLVNGELGVWGGSFSIPEAHGEGWRMERLNVHSNFKNGSFHADATAKDGSIDNTWKFYSELHPTQSETQEQVAWHDVSTKVEVVKGGGTIHLLHATENGNSRSWTAKGSWLRDSEFNGSLNVGATAGKGVHVFALHGEKGILSVQDQAH